MIVGPHPRRVSWIAHRGVEVNDRVELPARSNPLIDGLTFPFASRREEAGHDGAFERGQGGTEYHQPAFTSAFRDLPECVNDVSGRHLLFWSLEGAGNADVIDSRENHNVPGARRA